MMEQIITIGNGSLIIGLITFLFAIFGALLVFLGACAYIEKKSQQWNHLSNFQTGLIILVFIFSYGALFGSIRSLASGTTTGAREEGYSSGFDAGSEYGFDQGFNMGYEEGYRDGYDEGCYDSDDELSLYTITGDFTFEAAEVINEAFFQGDEYASTDEIGIEMAIEIVDCYKNNKPTEEGKRYSSKEYDEAVTVLYDFTEFFYERMYY